MKSLNEQPEKKIRVPDASFKLGTTSFIFPDHVIPNVEKLGAFFDEIEILCFESHPREVLLSKEDVKTLLHLSGKLDLTYNIHLPLDVSLTCESSSKRQRDCDTILNVIDLFAPLLPTTYTLHLDMGPEMKKEMRNQTALNNWKKRARQSLQSIASEVSRPDIISIETLDYPFSLTDSLVEEFDLSVCLDVGHQIKYGYDLLETYGKHQSRVSIIHLHGVAFSEHKIKDHTGLDQMPEKYFRQIQTVLEKFSGVVSLEVFNLENLKRSLLFLSKTYEMNVSAFTDRG